MAGEKKERMNQRDKGEYIIISSQREYQCLVKERVCHEQVHPLGEHHRRSTNRKTATSNAPETMGWWMGWSLAVEGEDCKG
jgi:hypothetical protein